MAPKHNFKVHSLSKHVAETQKGISAEAQYNRRAATAAALKKDSSGLDPAIFANNDSDSDSDSASDDSSDGEDQSAFLRKLTNNSSAPKKVAKNMKREVANSDAEREALNAKKPIPNKATAQATPESDDSESGSDSDSASGSESSEDGSGSEKEKASQTNGAAVATATTTTSPTSSSGEEESSDEDDDSNKNGVRLQKPAAAKEASSEDGSESESEESSSDSEESEPETTKKAAVNGRVPAAATTSSDDDSSSGSESGDEPAQSVKKAIPVVSQSKTVPAKKTAPASDSDSSDSASDEEDNAAVDESMHISDREEGGQLTGPKFIAPDFMMRRGDKDVNGKDVAEVCNQANLQGKQFWYFTVPSDIPISVVQNMEIPLDTAQRSDSVFSHNGDSYGVSFDNMTPKSTIQILIPSADGTKYQAAPRALDQVVQIKRITNLGGSSTGTADPSYKRPVRPQPKGLKARYKPIGVSNSMGTIGHDSEGDEADTEMADAPSLPALPAASPPATEPAKDKKKGKSKATADRKVALDTPKKSKKSKEKASEDAESSRKGKRKLTSSEEDAVAASSQLMGESELAESKSKKQKTDRAGSPDLSTNVTPVTLPTPGYSFSDLPALKSADNTTPKVASKKTTSRKKADEAPVAGAEGSTSTPSAKKTVAKKSASKIDLPVPSSSQPTVSRNTPIAPPVIFGQPVPSSSAPAPPASTPTPAAKPTKKTGSSKKKDATQVKP